MSKRLTVVISQGQSHNPAKRKLEEDIVATLLGERGIEVTVVPHLYDLLPDGTGMMCLQGIAGDFLVLAWMYPRAAHWILNRNGIRGRVGTSLLAEEDDEQDDMPGEEDSGDDKQRVVETLEIPDRTVYCIDLRARKDASAYLDEIRRIATECATETVSLSDWIAGDPQSSQMDRFLNPTVGNVAHKGNGNGQSESNSAASESALEPNLVAEATQRRWYPVIDFSRCTNCMECIDFCLFGVYGVDTADTILVEQPDNCRKGCPACSRVCPENAIIFPQHKTPAIAGSAEVAGSLKIDLSKLFGAPNVDAVDMAVRERDEQLLMAGRESVGHDIGLPRRQDSAKQAGKKDELDKLIDQLDEFDL